MYSLGHINSLYKTTNILIKFADANNLKLVLVSDISHFNGRKRMVRECRLMNADYGHSCPVSAGKDTIYGLLSALRRMFYALRHDSAASCHRFSKQRAAQIRRQPRNIVFTPISPMITSWDYWAHGEGNVTCVTKAYHA